MVRLTGIGASHLVLTLVLGFAAINTGNNSLYLALSFLLGTLVLSGIASKGGLRMIRVELVHVEDPWAGQPAAGMLRVRNTSGLWSVRDVVMVMPELHRPILVADLPRGASLEIPVEFSFTHRGRAALHHIDIYSRYPFGFFLKKIRRRISGETIVYPRLLTDWERRFGAAPDYGESQGTNRLGPGSEIFAFREYVRGDSLRHVHWRKSASLGRWIMKQPELEWVPAIRVVFDPVRPAGATAEEFEHLVSEATSFLHQALQGARLVTLELPRQTINGSGPAGWRSIFEALALVEPQEPGSAPALRHEPGDIVFSLVQHPSISGGGSRVADLELADPGPETRHAGLSWT